MRKLLFTSTILLLAIKCSFGQALISPIAIEPTEKLKSFLPDSIISTKSIDFDGDNKPDYICRVFENQNVVDYWLTSNYSIVNKEFISEDIFIFWFIQLDNDIELETFFAVGYSDGIDYWFSDFNFKSMQENKLLYFNPVILESIESKKKHWGFPWYIKNIYSKSGKILCSFSYEIDRDGAEITYPEWQSILPTVFFRSDSTNMDCLEDTLFDCQYLTVTELINKVKK